MWHVACGISHVRVQVAMAAPYNTKLQMHSIDRIFRWVHLTADENSAAPHIAAVSQKKHLLFRYGFEGSKQKYLRT